MRSIIPGLTAHAALAAFQTDLAGAGGAPPADAAPKPPPAAEPKAKRATMAWTGAGHTIKLNTLVRVPLDLAETLRASGRARDAEKAEIAAYGRPIQDLDAV